MQFYLTVTFVVALLITNIVVVKQISLPFGIIVTGGELVFPITYILSDVFSEVYGYKWSRITCYVAFAANAFMMLVFMAVIELPFPDYWQGQEALEMILGNTPRILIASAVAFVIGDFVNDVVFQRMKKKHVDSHKGFAKRAILSSFCGQIIDSTVFNIIAFSGILPIEVVIKMTISVVIIKTTYEIVILPLTQNVVKRVSKHERRTEVC